MQRALDNRAPSRRYGSGPAGSPFLRERAQNSKTCRVVARWVIQGLMVGNRLRLAVVKDGMRHPVIAGSCRGRRPALRRRVLMRLDASEH